MFLEGAVHSLPSFFVDWQKKTCCGNGWLGGVQEQIWMKGNKEKSLKVHSFHNSTSRGLHDDSHTLNFQPILPWTRTWAKILKIHTKPEVVAFGLDRISFASQRYVCRQPGCDSKAIKHHSRHYERVILTLHAWVFGNDFHSEELQLQFLDFFKAPNPHVLKLGVDTDTEQ